MFSSDLMKTLEKYSFAERSNSLVTKTVQACRVCCKTLYLQLEKNNKVSASEPKKQPAKWINQNEKLALCRKGHMSSVRSSSHSL